MATHKASGGGLISTLVVLALLVVAIGLYLRVLVGGRHAANDAPPTQASVQVVEGDEVVPAGTVRDLPDDQMAVIIKVFAPELQ